MEPIQVNSLVQLLSGGPIMTVESFANKFNEGTSMTVRDIADESRLNCEWFDGLELHQGTFEVAQLRPVAEHKPDKPLSERAVVSAYTGIDQS